MITFSNWLSYRVQSRVHARRSHVIMSAQPRPAAVAGHVPYLLTVLGALSAHARGPVDVDDIVLPFPVFSQSSRVIFFVPLFRSAQTLLFSLLTLSN